MRGALLFILLRNSQYSDAHIPSPVHCIRFSTDGKYLATGCYRTAQIYDAETGQKTWLAISYTQSSPLLTEKCSSVLVHDTAGEAGDLYIRSVCFSPDGKYLATGAEDAQIRVCHLVSRVSWLQIDTRLRSGISQRSASATFLMVTY